MEGSWFCFHFGNKIEKQLYKSYKLWNHSLCLKYLLLICFEDLLKSIFYYQQLRKSLIFLYLSLIFKEFLKNLMVNPKKWCNTCMMECQLCVCSCVYTPSQSNGVIHVWWDARCVCVLVSIPHYSQMVQYMYDGMPDVCVCSCVYPSLQSNGAVHVRWDARCMCVHVSIPHHSQMVRYMYDGMPDVCMFLCLSLITVKWRNTCMMGCQMCVCVLVSIPHHSQMVWYMYDGMPDVCVFLCVSLITVKWCNTCTMGCQMYVCVLVSIPHYSQMVQ